MINFHGWLNLLTEASNLFSLKICLVITFEFSKRLSRISVAKAPFSHRTLKRILAEIIGASILDAVRLTFSFVIINFFLFIFLCRLLLVLWLFEILCKMYHNQWFECWLNETRIKQFSSEHKNIVRPAIHQPIEILSWVKTEKRCMYSWICVTVVPFSQHLLCTQFIFDLFRFVGYQLSQIGYLLVCTRRIGRER